MFLAFLYFMAGIVTYKVLQFILSVKPNFQVYKQAEMCALNVLLQINRDKTTSLKLLKTLADETDPESYTKIENKLKANYDQLINNSIKTIKQNLPYKVSYNTIDEAYQIYVASRGPKDG